MADQLPEIEVLLKQLTPLIARLQAESASSEHPPRTSSWGGGKKPPSSDG